MQTKTFSPLTSRIFAQARAQCNPHKAVKIERLTRVTPAGAIYRNLALNRASGKISRPKYRSRGSDLLHLGATKKKIARGGRVLYTACTCRQRVWLRYVGRHVRIGDPRESLVRSQGERRRARFSPAPRKKGRGETGEYLHTRTDLKNRSTRLVFGPSAPRGVACLRKEVVRAARGLVRARAPRASRATSRRDRSPPATLWQRGRGARTRAFVSATCLPRVGRVPADKSPARIHTYDESNPGGNERRPIGESSTARCPRVREAESASVGAIIAAAGK